MRWMDWRLAHRRLDELKKNVASDAHEKKVQISRMTNRHLQKKKIIPMCRRIDQTRGTRHTSSFTPSTTSHGSTKFGEVITADHKVFSEDNEPILQHRCAVVMLDFSFYWTKRNPTRNGSADDTKKMCATILAALETTRINLHRKFSKFWCLRRFTLESRQIHSSPI